MHDILDGQTLLRLVQGMNVVFLVLSAALLALMLGSRGPRAAAGAPAVSRFRLVFLGGVVPLFAAVYVYQATWQLAGFARPQFVSFMRAYNRRPAETTRAVRRGRILDRTGTILAQDRPGAPGVRDYPLGRAACHVVGYSDPRYGTYGLERTDDALLSGRTVQSREEIERFARNMMERTRIDGHDLALTLDARLQARAVHLLAGRPGAVVAVRPRDGAVLVLASSPTFDPNRLEPVLFAEEADRAPLFNRALHGLYPAGSTFKMVVAALAVEQGIDREFDCPAAGFAAEPGLKPIRDHEFYDARREGREWRGHGRISMDRAFVRSSNVFFAQLGVALGPRAFNDAASRWLFNTPVAVQSIGGTMASKASRLPPFSSGEKARVAQVSIGQGELLVTPLHMAVLTAGVANDGLAYRPRIGAGVPPVVMGRITSRRVAGRIQRMMREVVRSGTARRADIPGLAVAGKTGTAQAPSGDDHSWFVCFAPVSAPALAVAVVVEHGGYGSRAALPVAARLLEAAGEMGLLSGEKAAGKGGTP